MSVWRFLWHPGVEGAPVPSRRAPAGSHRGGILTQASVLTVSSYPARTSPVLRGKWILENLLDSPPPAPPPNVPKLDETAIGATATHAPAAGTAPRQSGLQRLSRPHGPARIRS